MKIRAAVLQAAHSPFVIESLDLDEPRSDEVLVRMVATGICHTDLSVVEADMPAPLPMVLGHEGAGVVEKVGSAVKHVSPGDHVVLSYPHCGKCAKCRAGRPYYCEQLLALALAGSRVDGSCTVSHPAHRVSGCFFGQSSFATHALAYASGTVKVPRDAPLEMLAPLGCGIQTGAGTVLNVLEPNDSSSIAVFGCGPVGLAAVMAAKLSGCRAIVAVDRVPERLALAEELGATHTVNAASADALAVINSLGGVDFSVEATGNSKALETAVAGLKPFGGVCAMLGVPRAGSKMTLDHMHVLSGRSVLGVTQGAANPHEFIPRLVQLYMDGKLPMDKLVRTYPLEEINRAAADSAAGRTVKPVLLMGSSAGARSAA